MPDCLDGAGASSQNEVDDRAVVAIVPDAEVRPVTIPIDPGHNLVVGLGVAQQEAGGRRTAGAAGAGDFPSDEPIASADREVAEVDPLEAVQFLVHPDLASDSGIQAVRCGCGEEEVPPHGR